jgi:TetR/AcrR family tetracycline transcriptional repressor
MMIRRSANPRRVNRMVPQRNFADEGLISNVLPGLLLENVIVPEPDARPWDEQVKDLLAALVAALRVHPDASFLYLYQILQTDTLTVADRILDLLMDAGFALDAAADTAGQALRSLVTLMIAAPIRTHGGNVDVVDAAIRIKKAALSALDPRRYPHIIAAADALARGVSQEDYYERGSA